MKARLLALLLASAGGTAAMAQGRAAQGPGAQEAGAQGPMEWQPRPGAVLPLSAGFRDEAGRSLPFGSFFGAGVPVVLDLGYFRCPSLCGVARADLLAALVTSGLRPGQDYRLLVVSIDAAEASADAAGAKASDLRGAGLREEPAWRYLTGPASSSAAVAEAVGFPFRFDARLKQFTHPAGAVVLTASGRVSATLGGVGFDGPGLRRAVAEAARGGVAPPSLPVRLLCRFDAVTGRYSLAIGKVLRGLAVLTVLTIGGLLWALHRGGGPGVRRP